MIRLAVCAEGDTEREFVRRVLQPHLSKSDIDVRAIDLGGRVSLQRLHRELRRLLASFDFVTTLVDLYGLRDREERTAAQYEASIAAAIEIADRRRLIPYVQQYEFEALIFAAAAVAEEVLQQPGLAEQLQRQLGPGGPESVNDRRDTCPSRRIKHLVAHYDKKLHGPDILAAAELAVVRQACPRFDEWLVRLEALRA